jgi:hypothetical protein
LLACRKRRAGGVKRAGKGEWQERSLHLWLGGHAAVGVCVRAVCVRADKAQGTYAHAHVRLGRAGPESHVRP